MLHAMHESLLNTGGAPAPSAPVAGPHDEAARALYPEPAPPPKATAPNAEVAALRAADPARAFYSDVSNLGAHVVGELMQAIAPGAPPEVHARLGVELAGALVDVGFDRQDTERLSALARQFKANPLTAGQVAAAHREAFTTLRERYGADGVNHALESAKRLAQRDPRLAKLLDVSGLGDSSWLIQKMAELAQKAN